MAAGDAARTGIPFVGLTGGIGAGKSEALAALERLGAATLSSDAVVHEILATDEVRDELVERLGPEVAPGGGVDRNAVAQVVFGDDEARGWLEGYLWPRVGERIVSWRSSLDSREPAPRAAIVEVPLLFESDMERGFDHTIAVTAHDDLRAERIGARGHEGVASRESRQLSQDEKSQRADFSVRNDGTIEELERELSNVLARIES
ncbi:MAG: dephospho-CoA kinase [Thermoleophilaceae bacterium]|nr:dephospho-CoA kinase [Thermoleophilaceae bacterium]